MIMKMVASIRCSTWALGIDSGLAMVELYEDLGEDEELVWYFAMSTFLAYGAQVNAAKNSRAMYYYLLTRL